MILALGRLRQENCKLKACLGCIAIKEREERGVGGGKEGRKEMVGKRIVYNL